jgi:hypothetical protein
MSPRDASFNLIPENPTSGVAALRALRPPCIIYPDRTDAISMEGPERI